MKKILIICVSLLLTLSSSKIIFADIDLDMENDLDDNLNVGEHKKSSWYIGFGLGTGNGNFEYQSNEGSNEISFDELSDYADSAGPRITINIGLGAIINPQFHFGLDVGVIAQEFSYTGAENDYVDHLQINNYLLTLTFFPMIEGFFLKAGFGKAVFQIITTDDDSSSDSYSGFAFMGGIGYAFWLGETFNLCLNADYSVQSYSGSDGPDSSDFWALYVSCYWF